MNLQFGKTEHSRKMIWVSNYVMEKEYYLPKHIFEALDFINTLVYEKKLGPNLAIQKSNDFFEKKYSLTIGVDSLKHLYNSRMAHIRNGIKAYAEWSRSRREQTISKNPTGNKCACGCGQIVETGRKYINGHNNNHQTNDSTSINKISTEKIYERHEVKKLCACGCGGYVTNPKNKYINGHNSRCVDKNVLDEKARIMREALKLKKSKV